MRIRASQTLVFSLEANAIVAFNYLTGAIFECDSDLLALLSDLGEWSDFDRVHCMVPTMAADELRETLSQLIDGGAIVEQNSALATREAEHKRTWTWGLPSALFHFSVHDRQHMTLEATEDLQRAKAARSAQPDPFLKNNTDRQIILPDPSASELIQLMARRRTARRTTAENVTLQQVSECLFAGMGITGHTENCVGRLPLSMTPSGGARNPFEAFLLARRIDGLNPGLYHYSAVQHSLEAIEEAAIPPLPELLGGQDWVDDMPCIILLCAFFERSMWKYDDANAYRVVMIEAGHIGQNIMLAATRNSLSACPTAALNHEVLQNLLGLAQRSTQWPLYALTLGHPSRSS